MRRARMVVVAATVALAALVLVACGQRSETDAGSSSGSSDAGSAATTESAASWPAQEALAALSPTNVASVSWRFAGEGGYEYGETSDPEAVAHIYDLLLDLSLGDATTEGSDDNGLELWVETTDGETLLFAFESDVLVMDDGRFEVDGLETLKSYLAPEE